MYSHVELLVPEKQITWSNGQIIKLSLSEIVGTTQILSSGIQKPFYIYVHKINNTNGQLDVTVMK